MNAANSPSKGSIVLIGYRGSGKSTVGRLLAERTGLPLIDTDRRIMAQTGRSIADIFQRDGEPAFRRLEHDAIRAALAAGPCVLSAGGGAVEDADNVRRFRRVAHVVWLNACVDTLNERIRTDADGAARRPPLTSPGGGIEEIETVLARRAPLYRAAADLAIDTEDVPPVAVADRIVAALGIRTVDGPARLRATPPRPSCD